MFLRSNLVVKLSRLPYVRCSLRARRLARGFFKPRRQLIQYLLIIFVVRFSDR